MSEEIEKLHCPIRIFKFALRHGREHLAKYPNSFDIVFSDLERRFADVEAMGTKERIAEVIAGNPSIMTNLQNRLEQETAVEWT